LPEKERTSRLSVTSDTLKRLKKKSSTVSSVPPAALLAPKQLERAMSSMYITYPLANLEPYTGSYVGAGLQIFYCAKQRWEDTDNPFGSLVTNFMNQKMDISHFAEELERQLEMGELRQITDVRKFVCGVIGKFAAQDKPGVATNFEFRQQLRHKKCNKCGKAELPPKGRGPSNYHMYIDGNAPSVQARINATLSSQHQCIDCSCSQSHKAQQVETISYRGYPDIAILCTSSSEPIKEIDKTIILGENSKYHLYGYVVSSDVYATAIVRHSKKWYLCDNTITPLATIQAAVEYGPTHGVPVLFAYKKFQVRFEK